MNLALKRVTTGGKGRGEIRSKIGKVTGMAADMPTVEINKQIILLFCPS